MLTLPDLPKIIVGRLAERLVFDLQRAVAAAGLLPQLHELLELVHPTLARLAAGDPGNAGWQHDLCTSHDMLGDVQMARGDLTGALEAYRAGLDSAQRLVMWHRVNADGHRDLRDELSAHRDFSVMLTKVGDVLRAQGDLTRALEAYRAVLPQAQHLLEADPGNKFLQHDLSVSHSRVADVLAEQGDLAGALEAYGESRAILRRLAVADPGNAAEFARR